MSEYLTEEEQVERLKQWWRDNGRSIIAGVVIGLAIFGGWQGWKSYEVRKAEEGAAAYDEFIKQSRSGDAPAAMSAEERLRAEFPGTVYTDFATLEVAGKLVADGKLDDAAAQLRSVLESGAGTAIRELARLRLARVLMAQNQLDQAASLLSSEPPAAFAGEMALIRGDLARARGQRDEARAAYEQARELGAGDRQWLDLVLQDLGEGSTG